MKILNTTTKPCIYLIINNINNKKYVGQTMRFQERMWEHQNDLRHMSVLQHAFQKYGVENFTAQVLVEIVDNIDIQGQLDELEKFYIKKYKTFGNDGYNCTSGGQTSTHKLGNEVVCFDYEYKNIIGVYPSLSDAERSTGVTYVNILYCTRNSNGKGNQMLHAGDYGWMNVNYTNEELNYRQQEVAKSIFYSYEVDNKKQPIISTERKHIKQVVAGEELQVNPSCIKQILRGANKTTVSYQTHVRYTFSRTKLSECEDNAHAKS